MDINKIKPYGKNAKKHPVEQIKKIADSIKEFGFNQPVVVDKNGVLIVGHGRYEAAKLLGIKEIPAIEVNLTEEQANAYRLADNKLNESEFDMGLVVDELKGLSDYMISLTGFDKELLLEKKGSEIPEVVFSEELLEERNYIVLVFDNEIDWLQLTSVYPLKNVKDGNFKMDRFGTGRVVKGSDFLNKILNK